MKKIFYPLALASAILSLSACSDDDTVALRVETDANYVGTAQGVFTADEWYPGGKLGTTDNC